MSGGTAASRGAMIINIKRTEPHTLEACGLFPPAPRIRWQLRLERQTSARKPVEMTKEAYAISALDATPNNARPPIHSHQIFLCESPRHIHLERI